MIEESVRANWVPPSDCTDNPLSPPYAHVAYPHKLLICKCISGSPQIHPEGLWITQNPVIPALIEEKSEDHQGDHRDNPHPVCNQIFVSRRMDDSLDTGHALTRPFGASSHSVDLSPLDITSYRDNVRINGSFVQMIFPKMSLIKPTLLTICRDNA